MPQLAHWRGWLARGLATAGAALFIYAAFAPWVTITYPPDPNAGAVSLPYSYSLSSDQLVPVVPFVLNRLTHSASLPFGLVGLGWLGIVTGGVLLATTLWMRFGPRGALLARCALLAWAALAALGTVVLLGSYIYVLRSRGENIPGASIPQFTMRPDPHLALVPLALALTLAGVVALLIEGHRDRGARASAAPQPSTPGRLPRFSAGALVLTVGVLIWALGFFAVPWATVNCTSIHLSLNHFVDGVCAGLDAGDALVYSPKLGVKAIDSSTTPGTILTVLYALAAGYGLLVLLVAWQRGVSRVDLLASGCWLLAVTFVAGLAVRGIQPILAQSPALSAASAAGQWVVGPGVVIAFGGLVFAWWGLILLWRAALRWRPAIFPAM